MRLRRKRKADKTPLAVHAESMTLTQHLAELRMRLIRVLLAVVLFGVIVFALYDPWIQSFLFHPYRVVCDANPSFNCNGNPLLTTPLGGITTRMKVAGWGGLILAMPVVLWQIWRFIVPGLESKEKKYARPFLLATIALFLLGAAFAYLTLSKALQWLISYSGAATAAFTPESYVSLVGLMMAAFGVGFLFPVLLVFLELIGVIDYKQLSGARRYAIVAIVVVAAVITPSGDPISMLALAIPMYLFYEISVVIGWVVSRRRAKAAAKPAVGTA
jgi:sec-independent protein translocase protein TatC